MMFKVFIISVAIAFSIEIVHSVLTKGVKFTLEFFGGGFLFGFAREFIYFSFLHNYDAPNLPIKLLNVPIFIPIGWVFTFYLAYEFVNKLIEPKTVNDYKDFIIFAALFSTFICIPIETAALNMHWWNVYFYMDGYIAPFALMAGWICTSLVFFYIYFIVKKKLPIKQLWFVFFLLIFIFMAETNLRILVLGIIVLLGMLKYNKEIIFIMLIYSIVFSFISTKSFLFLPNGFFVTVLFIFNFIFILVKLRLREEKHQLSIKE